MVQWLLKKIVGSKNQRELKQIYPVVEKINALEKELESASDDDLRAKTKAWQERLHAIEDFDELQGVLDEILPEAYAVVKNASRRLCGQTFQVCDYPLDWNMVHFDVQLIGGIALHRGMIAEMATGEGKTLVGTLPTYLNALTGRGVHMVTVNDYLARRDAEWMGALYSFLGLNVGCIQNNQPPEVRRKMYSADITFGTNSEFGFDYLRDNGMAQQKELKVQRDHYYAIVDEVDSVLIDEARTPLIISGPVAHDNHQYDVFKPLIDRVVKKQTELLDGVIKETKELVEKGEKEEAGHAMFKLKLGAPRHAELLRFMEDTELRRAMEKAELSYYANPQKTELFALKEELYFTIDDKGHDAELSEKGRTFMNPDDPDAFVLPDITSEFADLDGNHDLSLEERSEKKKVIQDKLDNQSLRIHNITQLLKAYCLYKKDDQYVLVDNKVVIVDENTGREMPGRRWSDGLHQAVEAKEGVTIDRETQTLATITIQNYFRLYSKLGGMTGTAETDAAEFADIYRLDVLTIPTNKPVLRADDNDAVFKTQREKLNAVVLKVRELNDKGQPILIGTASVESSEIIGRMLAKEKIKHNVLNAKFHLQEAEIVRSAGQKGAVTVSTNMAGRGTDIKLGEGVSELGGLFVLGTERHQSRRVDRQLRGRCARQGDPGESKFYASFEDDLMRQFGAQERMTKLMERFGLEEGQELEHPWLSKSVENAQKKVEQRNYTSRKRILDYDDVMNSQREVVYGYRNEVLDTDAPRDLIYEVIDEAVPIKVSEYIGEGGSDNEGPNQDGLIGWIQGTFPIGIQDEDIDGKSEEEVTEFLTAKLREAYDLKAAAYSTGDKEGEGKEQLTQLAKHMERLVILSSIDKLWQDHLYQMDGLREGIHMRSQAQKDPLIEYKTEAYKMFVTLMEEIKVEALNNLFRGSSHLRQFEEFLTKAATDFVEHGKNPFEEQQRQEEEARRRMIEQRQAQQAAQQASFSGGTVTMSSSEIADAQQRKADAGKPKLNIKKPQEAAPKAAPVRQDVGRNDPCPCGSGKKFKACCGKA